MYFYILQKLIMKNLKSLALLWAILVIWSLAGCGSKNNDVVTNNIQEEENGNIVIEDITSDNNPIVEYNDTIVDLAAQCVSSEDYIWERFDDENSSIEDIQLAIDNTIRECTDSDAQIRALWSWEWDSTLMDWVLNLIEKEIVYYNKFNELVPYLSLEWLTEEENNEYETLFDELDYLNLELKEANDRLIQIQKDFADKYWYVLEDDEDYEDEYEDILVNE